MPGQQLEETEKAGCTPGCRNLILGFLAILALSYAFAMWQERETTQPAPQARVTPSAPADECRVRDGRTYGQVLATEMGSPALAGRFDRLIDQITSRCPETCSDVSDRIMRGYQLHEQRGGSASLIDIAVGWERTTRDGVADCTEALSLLLVMLEQ